MARRGKKYIRQCGGSLKLDYVLSARKSIWKLTDLSNLLKFRGTRSRNRKVCRPSSSILKDVATRKLKFSESND